MNHNIIEKIMDRKDSYESEIARLKKQLNDYRDYVKHDMPVDAYVDCRDSINYLCTKDTLLLRDYLKRENVTLRDLYLNIKEHCWG